MIKFTVKDTGPLSSGTWSRRLEITLADGRVMEYARSVTPEGAKDVSYLTRMNISFVLDSFKDVYRRIAEAEETNAIRNLGKL